MNTMNAEQIISLIVAVLTGLATCVPLAYKLVEYVKTAMQSLRMKNLKKIM